jgi:hypothetical protein
MQKTMIQLGLLIAMTAGTAFGQVGLFANIPVISSAAANFAVKAPTLTINGQTFGVPHTVTLGGTPLTVQSFTQCVAVAILPPGGGAKAPIGWCW